MEKCKHEWRQGVAQFSVAGGRYVAYEQYCRKCGVTEYVTPGMDQTDEEIARRRAKLPLEVERGDYNDIYCPACGSSTPSSVRYRPSNPAPCSTARNPHAWELDNAGKLVAVAIKEE
jgi:predicted nucleic-acid-binding Zn-ribbon protein